MAGRYIICPVGTSLLTNRGEGRTWDGWDFGNELPSSQEVLKWLRHAEPTRASAEVHTLHRLQVDTEDHLLLLSTSTPEGRFCAGVLKEFYSASLKWVGIEEVEGLGYKNPEAFSAGLRALVNAAITHIKKAREAKRYPVICATAGFKPEGAYLTLLGALMGVEVYYVHELHRQLVKLPRLPLHWDTNFFISHRQFFEWINHEPRTCSEVESRLKSSEELKALVEEDEGAIVSSLRQENFCTRRRASRAQARRCAGRRVRPLIRRRRTGYRQWPITGPGDGKNLSQDYVGSGACPGWSLILRVAPALTDR